MTATILTADQLRRLVRAEDLVEPLASAFADFSAGYGQQGILTLYPGASPDDGDVYVKTGALAGHPLFVVKISPWFAANATAGAPQGGLIAVFDSRNGHTRALLEDEHYLSDIRTAATGALVARQLAPELVRSVGVLGTGTQAFLQVQALQLARLFERVFVWGRRRSAAEALAAKLRAGLANVLVTVAATPREVAEAADLIITATASREPLLHADWLRPGQHVTSVGADDETKCELDPRVLARADRLIVDSRATAVTRGNVGRAIAAGTITADAIDGEIGEVVAGTIPGRRNQDELTVATLVGLGIQDLVAAEIAVQRHEQEHP